MCKLRKSVIGNGTQWNEESLLPVITTLCPNFLG